MPIPERADYSGDDTRRPRIVVLGKYYYPHQGGTEEYAKICANVLQTIGDVRVVCFGETAQTKYEVIDGIEVVRCGRLTEVMSQPISFAMAWELRRLKPDIVLYNAPNYVGALAILLGAPKAKIVVVHHSDVFGRKIVRDLVHPFHLAVLKRSAAVVVNSLRNVRTAIDLPATDVPVVSIPLGLSDAAYVVDETVQADAARLRARLPCRFVAGFIGRHVRYKGLGLIVEAISRTKDIGCLIVGDGPKRAETEQLVERLGLRDRVLFLGTVDHAQKLAALEASDAVLLPSTDKGEAFGLVQIEGQFLEKPVIVSDLPTGVRDITVPGVSGLMVNTGDVDSLVDALERLAGNPEEARRMGLAGRKIALAKFTEKVFRERLSELMSQVLRGSVTMAGKNTLRLVKSSAME